MTDNPPYMRGGYKMPWWLQKKANGIKSWAELNTGGSRARLKKVSGIWFTKGVPAFEPCTECLARGYQCRVTAMTKGSLPEHLACAFCISLGHIARCSHLWNPETWARLYDDTIAARDGYEPKANPPLTPPPGHPSLLMTANFCWQPAAYHHDHANEFIHTGRLSSVGALADPISRIRARENWINQLHSIADFAGSDPTGDQIRTASQRLLTTFTYGLGPENRDMFTESQLWEFFKKPARDYREQVRQQCRAKGDKVMHVPAVYREEATWLDQVNNDSNALDESEHEDDNDNENDGVSDCGSMNEDGSMKVYE